MYGTTGNSTSAATAAAAASGSRTPTIPYPILHRHQVQHPLMMHLPPPPSPQPYFASGSVGGDEDEFPRRDERFPQWGNQETRDLIEIRAELEWEFTATKRNKNLWEMVATRMREKGHRRTSDQCKCKWKNLVNRYKGQEVSDVENSRLCPFFDELHAVFTARSNRMNQSEPEPETGLHKARKRAQSHEDISEDQNNGEETELNQTENVQNVLRRKPGKEKRQKMVDKEKEAHSYPAPSPRNESTVFDALQEIMRNFIMHQQKIDTQWRESMEKRAEEREMFEQEWREKMEKLERERLMMEQAWREREDQRRLKEESRAEKRDALLTMLLNKLIRDNSP